MDKATSIPPINQHSQTNGENGQNGSTKDKDQNLQSNLPLLFANGDPTSLETMTLRHLQHFLIFMLKCERGSHVSSLENINKPQWWPPDIPYADSILRFQSKKGLWSSRIRSIIRACYKHHKSQFLLEFSDRLRACTEQIGRVITVDNGDGTRSMKSTANGNLLVTFRAENQDYDRRIQASFNNKSPLRGVRSLGVSTHNSSDPGLPQCIDVYLCDDCGKAFDTFNSLLSHERLCVLKNYKTPESSTEVKEESKLFHYLGLRKKAPIEEFKTPQPPPIVRPKPSSYAKFLSIDVSSPLGRYIISLAQDSTMIPINLEALCNSDRRGMRSIGIDGFPVTYGRNPKARLNAKRHHHVYCFTKEEKLERLKTLNSGLTPRALRLYNLVNRKTARVVLVRLRFRDNRLPPTGTVKLAFDDKMASLRFLNTPKDVPRGAKLVPLLTRLRFPPSNPRWRSLVNNNKDLAEDQKPIPKWRPYPRPEVQCIDLCSSDDNEEQPKSVDVVQGPISVTIPRIAPHLANF